MMSTLNENENAFDELKEQLNKIEDYYEYASIRKRVINYIIDLLAIYFVAIVFVVATAFIGFAGILIEQLGMYFLIVLIMIAYYVLMEYYTGQTIGKMITKTKVVDEFGKKPSLKKIFVRTFSRFIPFEAITFCGSGFGLHDSFSGTKVVLTEVKKIDEMV